MKKLCCFALLLCLALTGCTAAPSQTPQENDQPVTLTFMMPQTHYKDFLQQLLADFEEEYPGIHIEPQIIPDNQWINVVKSKAIVGETPDLIRIDKTLLMSVGTEHFIEFTQEEPWYDRVIPEQLPSKLVDGHLYGLPVGSYTALGIVYNRRIFEQYNLPIPRTMDEFESVCKVLLENGVIPLYASDKDSWTAQMGFGDAAPQVVPEETWQKLKDGSLRWSEVPEFCKILEDMRMLREKGYTNSDFLEASYTSAITAIAQERAAMYMAGEFFISDVKKENPDIDLMMMAMPYNGDLLTITESPGQISIFANTEHPEEAKLFLNWFSQAEQMDIFISGWGHGKLYKDQNMPLSESQQVLYEEYVSQGKTVPEVSNIMEGIDLSAFWGYQQEVIAGTLQAEEALQKWDEVFVRQLQDTPLSP